MKIFGCFFFNFKLPTFVGVHDDSSLSPCDIWLLTKLKSTLKLFGSKLGRNLLTHGKIGETEGNVCLVRREVIRLANIKLYIYIYIQWNEEMVMQTFFPKSAKRCYTDQ